MTAVSRVQEKADLQIGKLKDEIHELKQELEKNKAQLAQYKKMAFGKKSEKKGPTVEKAKHLSKKRGQQPSVRSRGRKILNLPIKKEIIELKDHQAQCPQCFLDYQPMNATNDSEVVEVSVSAYKRVIKRMKYKHHPQCQCPKRPKIITAPPAAKCVSKGKLGASVYTNLLIGKFGYQIPIYRLIKQYSQYGIDISQGTVTDGFKKLLPALQPIYNAIFTQSQKGKHWHVDETGWKVFKKIAGKKTYNWYLWVYLSQNAVVYMLEPSRGAKVPEKFFSKVNGGWINCDRYAVYPAIAKKHRLLTAFCWVHMRRDFLNLTISYPELNHWALSWANNISELFHINHKRTKLAENNQPYNEIQSELEEKMGNMKLRLERQLKSPALHEEAITVLKRMDKHWHGLNTFLHNPEIPMDNNPAESALRGPVVGRKNYYGSGSLWSAQLSAVMFTIIETLKKWHINPTTWLTQYLLECAKYNNKPPWHIVEEFLPWKMDIKQKNQLARPLVA